MASHRYREIFFPWPHLLFEDYVFSQFYSEQYGRQGVKPAKINKLTHLHYIEKIHQLGFEIVECKYVGKHFDEDFYYCFEEKLGLYPKCDLEKDFINLHLYKSN